MKIKFKSKDKYCAPTVFPTEQEFEDPKIFINLLYQSGLLWQYGIVLVHPPPSFKATNDTNFWSEDIKIRPTMQVVKKNKAGFHEILYMAEKDQRPQITAAAYLEMSKDSR